MIESDILNDLKKLSLFIEEKDQFIIVEVRSSKFKDSSDYCMKSADYFVRKFKDSSDYCMKSADDFVREIAELEKIKSTPNVNDHRLS